MKKYIYLFLSTFIIVMVIVMSGYMLSGETAQADVLILKARSMNNTITAAGKLQYKSGFAVRTVQAGIINNMAVKNGDYVKQNDLLFSYYKIDDAYTAMLSQYTGSNSPEALLGILSQYGSTEDILNEAKKYCAVENVYAAEEGKVTDVKYGADDVVEKNDVILKIADQQQAEVPVNINESHIHQISVGQKADIVFNAVPDKHYTGRVTHLASEAEITNGVTGKETTVEVTLTVEGHDDLLRVGYSAVCSIITSTDENVLVVPYDVIRTDDRGDYVLVADDGFVRRVPVKIGTEYKDGAAITEGLSENDNVIVNYDTMTEGQKVAIRNRTVQTND